MASDSERFFAEWPQRSEKSKSAMPDAVKGFGGLFAAVMKAGALSVREKELIALGIGMAVRCDPCINLHVRKSLEAGATRQQILEAASVAVMMQGGPTYTYLPKVVEALEALEQSGK